MITLKKLNHETYDDGILTYGSIGSKFNSSKKKIGEEFNPKGKLFFKQLSSRDSDILQASNMGYVIDLKLKVPYRPDISSKNKVKINNEIYDIKKFDSNKTEIFLYLQRVGV